MANSISYIIPCFNCSDTVDETFQSILDGNIEDGDEVIFIDDASTDDTFSKLAAYGQKYDFVKVARHNINKGTAAAGRNTGIDRSKNDLIFCLDADNILYPSSVRKLKEFLLANELDAAAFGRIDYFAERISNVTHSWTLIEDLDFITALNNPTKTPCGSGNYLFTKAVWTKVGRCHEFLGGAYDSDIFGLKLLAEGARFRCLGDTSYLHRYGYESTYVKEYTRKNTSLLYLAAIKDYLDQIHKDDIKYMFGKGRYTWRENIEKRPIRAGSGERKEYKPGLLKKIVTKIKSL
jgi:glycosyltransferase involved in cell wall biosynthesis